MSRKRRTEVVVLDDSDEDDHAAAPSRPKGLQLTPSRPAAPKPRDDDEGVGGAAGTAAPGVDARQWMDKHTPTTCEQLAVAPKKVADVRGWLQFACAPHAVNRALLLTGTRPCRAPRHPPPPAGATCPRCEPLRALDVRSGAEGGKVRHGDVAGAQGRPDAARAPPCVLWPPITGWRCASGSRQLQPPGRTTSTITTRVRVHPTHAPRRMPSVRDLYLFTFERSTASMQWWPATSGKRRVPAR